MSSNPIRAAGLVIALAMILAACTGGPVPNPPSTDFPDPTPNGPTRPAAPNAAGPENLDSIDIAVQRDDGGADGVVVTFNKTSRTAADEKPAAPRRFVTLFDRTIQFNSEVFPTCERTVLEVQGTEGCPQGSQVGRGRVDIYPQGSAEIAVFNAPRNPDGTPGILITVPATRSVNANTLERVVAPYDADFGYALDEITPPSTVPPGERTGIAAFHMVLGATLRIGDQVHSFVRSSAPPNTSLRFGQWSEFVTGQVARPTNQAPRP